MSATTWLIIAIVGFSLSGVAFIAAVFMFIKMNVPAIIGDLSGKTIAREVKAMREANSSKAVKVPQSGVEENGEPETLASEKATGNAEAVKVAHASKRLDRTADSLESAEESEPISKERTETLSTNATEILIEDTTEILTPLTEEKTTSETTVLSEEEYQEEPELEPVAFKVVYDEVVIHTDEKI